MRMFIIVIIIVLAVIVGWYYTTDSINQYSTAFIKQLDHISETIQDKNWSDVSIEYDRIKENWNKFRKLLTVFLDHHEIDNIDLSIARAEQYIKTKNEPLSLAEIEVLKQLFLIVNESESLTFTNIF